MFNPGNTLASNTEIPMSRIEFKRWRQFNGWTRSQAARQLGLDRATIEAYEIQGNIPKPIQQICRRI
jgi:DNA-binding XRE family transcriptional regulator